MLGSTISSSLVGSWLYRRLRFCDVDTAGGIHQRTAACLAHGKLLGSSLGLDHPKETALQQLHSFTSSPVTKCQHPAKGLHWTLFGHRIRFKWEERQPEACKMRRWSAMPAGLEQDTNLVYLWYWSLDLEVVYVVLSQECFIQLVGNDPESLLHCCALNSCLVGEGFVSVEGLTFTGQDLGELNWAAGDTPESLLVLD